MPATLEAWGAGAPAPGLPRACAGAEMGSGSAWTARAPGSTDLLPLRSHMWEVLRVWELLGTGRSAAASSGPAVSEHALCGTDERTMAKLDQRNHLRGVPGLSPWNCVPFSLAEHFPPPAVLPLCPGEAVSGPVLGLVHWESWKVRAGIGLSSEGPLLFLVCLFFVVFLPFLGPLPQHIEVPRPGVPSELKPPAYARATAMWDRSHI